MTWRLDPRPRLALVALAALPALAGAAPGASASPAPIPERLDALAAATLAREQVPGLAVAVVQRGHVVVAKGYGLANVEHGVPVKPETIFQSGSLGKQFTAAAIMLLVEDGKISLDDPITRFHPDAPWRWGAITVRHLLTHTSGIPDYEDTTFDLRKDLGEDELARLAFAMKLEFEPGTRWSYSNTGYVLLGTIVRKASGRFYGDLLRDRVFAPLGMRTARVISEEDLVPNRAAGYRLVNGALKNQEWVAPVLNTTADGSLYLSILDLVAWDAGVRAGAILRKESWAQVFTPVRLASGKTYPYGFGWFVDGLSGQPRQHHSGGWQGFKSYLSRYLADDLTVIVLANQAALDPGPLVERIAALFNPALGPRTEPIADREPAVTERARRLLDEARAGTLRPEELARVRAGFFPAGAKAAQAALQAAGSVGRLELLEARDEGDDRVYRYRARCERGALELRLGVAPDGRIATFVLRPRPAGP